MNAVTTDPTTLGAIAALATAWADDRDPAVLADLRRRVRGAATWDAGFDATTATADLVAAGALAEAVALVRGRMPGAFLSPRAHGVLAAALDELGEPVRAERERRIARLGVEAVLTGADGAADGTAERPWVVLRVADEYDVLRSQGRRSRSQRLVTRHGVVLDHHVCTDDSEAWFDAGLLGARSPAP